MPQAVNNSSSLYERYNELNESQVNVCDIQISGLIAKSTAIAQIFTHELIENKLAIKTKEAKQLRGSIERLYITIDKKLLPQLSRIKEQMKNEFHQMALSENTETTNTETDPDQNYIKTITLLQDNILQINENLESTTKRVFGFIPLTKKNELQTLFDSLRIYQSTLCGINSMSTNYSRFNILLLTLKSKIELHIETEGQNSNNSTMLELSSSIDQLITKNENLFKSFMAQKTNELPIEQVFSSATQKYLNLVRQLKEGNFCHPDLLLAIAQRHDTNAIVTDGLQGMQLIQTEYNNLTDQLNASFEQLHLDDINALVEELIESESAAVVAVPATPKKPQKPVPVSTKQAVELDVAEFSENQETNTMVQKPLSNQFCVELAKLADWLMTDIKSLSNSKSEEKRQMSQTFSEQLEQIRDQIDSSNWPTENTKALEKKTNIEKRLTALGQLIEEAMAQSSPPPSPKPKAIKIPEKAVTPEIKPVTEVKAPALSAFDTKLQVAIQKLSLARTRLFDAYSNQEKFKQTLLQSHQPQHTAWFNINQTDLVLDFISCNIALNSHTVFVKPYIQHCLPMAEMIRSIQAERFHVHFDEKNCQAYLGWASDWLDTLKPHFEYLEQLLSFTESMLTGKSKTSASQGRTLN